MALTEILPGLVTVIPLISSIIIPIAGMINRLYSWHIVVAATFACFLISLFLLNSVLNYGTISYWFGGWQPPWGIEYVIDSFSGFVLVIMSFISFMIAISAGEYVKKQVGEERMVLFYTLYMLLVTGALGIVTTGDMFNLYIFLEIASLSGYALVAIGKKRAALVASYNYLILGTIGAVLVLLAIGFLYMVTGTLNMADLNTRLADLYHSRVVLVAFALFIIGFSIKFALFPLHAWLLGAHSEAPSVISSILAAVVLKVSAYAMIRVMFSVFSVEFSFDILPSAEILLALSSIAIIVGAVQTLAQTTLKRMLAYSSIGQMGYIVLGVALANQIALTGSLIHILNHAIMKGALFLIAGSIIYKTGIYNLSELKGLGKKMPLSMAAFTICGLSMIGVPLTAGFVSKWYIAVGSLDAGMWYFVPVLLISSLIGAVYFGRVIHNVYFAQEPEHERHKGQNTDIKTFKSKIRDEAPIGMLIPTLILAGLCIFFGIAASIPVSIAEKAANMLLMGGM